MPKRLCRHCRKRFPAEGMYHVPCGAFCTYSHMLEYTRANKDKAQQKLMEYRRKADNAEKRERKANHLPHQLELTRLEVNKLVRLIDKGKPCISCGEYRELEAGHYRSVGSMPSLRFDTRNIHGQCRPCNGGGTRSMRRGKNPALVRDEYEKRLRERMGNDLVDWLNGPHEVKHWSIAGLKQLRKEVAEEIRRLESGAKPVWDWRAFP